MNETSHQQHDQLDRKPGVTDYTGTISTAPEGNSNRTTTYPLGKVTSWTPTTQPGKTLYYGGASNGPARRQWAASEVAITWQTNNTALVLTVTNNAISWAAQPGVTDSSGTISTATTGASTTSQNLANSSRWTPTTQPGKKLYYGVASNGPANVVREGLAEPGPSRRSLPDDLTISAFPFVPAEFAGFIVAAFMSPAHAVILSVVIFGITLTLMKRGACRKILRRLAHWMASPDDDQ